jgi:hypothetical protein
MSLFAGWPQAVSIHGIAPQSGEIFQVPDYL